MAFLASGSAKDKVKKTSERCRHPYAEVGHFGPVELLGLADISGVQCLIWAHTLKVVRVLGELGADGPRLMTRLQLDNAARHALRTAREVQAVLRDPNREAEVEGVLAELLLDFGEMTGSSGLLQPAVRTLGEAEKLARLVVEAAVFVRAHNWATSHLQEILHKAREGQGQPHAGECLVADFLEGLGTLQLVASSDGTAWELRILKEVSAGDENLSAILKTARYLLNPSFLMIFGDVTEILGKAVYVTNVKRFAVCVASIQALTTECLPRQARYVKILTGPDLPCGSRLCPLLKNCSLKSSDTAAFGIRTMVSIRSTTRAAPGVSEDRADHHGKGHTSACNTRRNSQRTVLFGTGPPTRYLDRHWIRIRRSVPAEST
ncbi:hypothetical protein [Streptomyces sp. NBC_00986]|uniref:hypothetical protein n=1 Tax=Streptomyces sp. NBC_00986 TaxID=2903702 RepID=UPI003870E229|nr:hypothetical protein OG504_33115 [Streptomyces sp. NBC_00986]